MCLARGLSSIGLRLALLVVHPFFLPKNLDSLSLFLGRVLMVLKALERLIHRVLFLLIEEELAIRFDLLLVFFKFLEFLLYLLCK